MSSQNLTQAVNRIIIGDVGSGKTIVSFLIGLSYLKNLDRQTKEEFFNKKKLYQKPKKLTRKNSSKSISEKTQPKTKKTQKLDLEEEILNPATPQAALLAPTEVLAYQHYQNLLELKNQHQELLSEIKIIYFSGKQNYFEEEKLTSKKIEQKIQAHFQENPANKIFWIGTHALLFKDYIQADLVLVDEQHRFGVNQRQKLTRNKKINKNTILSSHFISLTATPIPRTLALTLYRNLKPQFLERLNTRKKIETKILTFENLNLFETEIKNHLNKNRKVYIICPRVEEDEEDENYWSVNKAGRHFQKIFDDQVLMVHGKKAEKKDILQEFKDSKQKNILVSTTVVEVGVDVPTASLIGIFNAEKFGLAALHQIRGRVGRNNYDDNQCYLITEKKFSFSKRLRFLCLSQDGFAIAEKDLELRGSGDILGRVQSGFDSEIESILGLDPELYTTIQRTVDDLDFDNIQNLPRLKKYLESQSKEIWRE